MIQTLAIFKDAYRELNSKRLFWIVMAISVAVVASFCLLGNNERGITIVGYTIDVPFFSTRAVSTAGFYKFIFANVGVRYWLSWGATILALISTAGMIPDFVASGSIDMSLCKPIGRLRLFLTKYTAGLLFVALQVLVFSIGALFVIGIRGKSWEPSVFLAVPMVVAIYSFLYCVCALVGLVTRSGIAALLLTMLFWLLIWAFNTTEIALLQFKLNAKRDMDRSTAPVGMLEQNVAELKRRLDALRATGQPPSSDNPPPVKAPDTAGSTSIPTESARADSDPNDPRPPDGRPPRGRARRDFEQLAEIGDKIAKSIRPTNDPVELESRLAEQQATLDRLQKAAKEHSDTYRSLAAWQQGLFIAKTIFPKTGETAELLKRYVIDKKDREGLLQMIEERTGDNVPKDVQNVLDSRSVAWVAGTSFGFEAVVLAIACWIFCRKDF